MRPIQIIGAASGAGAPDPGCALGPAAVRNSGLLAVLRKRGADISWRAMLDASPEHPPLAAVEQLCHTLAEEVLHGADEGALPLVIEGDHSCAIGTWSGAFLSLEKRGPLGLVWIDAHMDSHTPETSPSGAIHGMPLAALLGYGRPELCTIGSRLPKLQPRHLCLVGVRSYERGEAELLTRLGVRIFHMREVQRRGIAPVMAEALALAREGTAGFGISIDLDAFSPAESPGVGTPVQHGLHHLELDRVLRGIAADPRLVALELAEFNPLRDRGGRTLKLIGDILTAVVGVERD